MSQRVRNFSRANRVGDVFYNGGVATDSSGALLVDSGPVGGTRFRFQEKGKFINVATANVTYRKIQAIPDGLDVYAVIAAIPNTWEGGNDLSPVVGRCSIRTQADKGDEVWSDAPGWNNFLFDTFVDFSAPPEVGGSPGWVFSDLLYIDLLKYVGVTYWARAQTCYARLEHTMTAGPDGTLDTLDFVAFRQEGINGVTDPTALNTPVYNDRICPVMLIALTRQDVYHRALWGGSDDDAFGDTEDLGTFRRMFKNSVADGGMVVATTVYADAAGDTATMLEVFKTWIATDADADEVQFPLTQGDDEENADYLAGVAAGTEAGWAPYENRIKAQTTFVIHECYKRGIACRIRNNRYRTGVAGSEYAMLQRLTQFSRDLEAGTVDGVPKCFLEDMVAMFNDETAAVGTASHPEYTDDDNVHRNAAGCEYRAQQLLAKIRSGH